MLIYVDKNEIKEEDIDIRDIEEEAKKGIILYKDSEDLYIAREDNKLEGLSYEEVIYKLYMRNKTNKRIYFVGFEPEEVGKIEMVGRQKKNTRLDLSLLKSAPKFVDPNRPVKSEYVLDDNIIDIKYTVGEDENQESFNLKLNLIFDASLEYTEGEILTEEYMEEAKKQIAERVKSNITIRETTKGIAKVRD